MTKSESSFYHTIIPFGGGNYKRIYLRRLKDEYTFKKNYIKSI